MENKLPEGVLLEMAEPVDSCLGCYFLNQSLEDCPKDYAAQSSRILSCVNDRDVIFKEIKN